MKKDNLKDEANLYKNLVPLSNQRVYILRLIVI